MKPIISYVEIKNSDTIKDIHFLYYDTVVLKKEGAFKTTAYYFKPGARYAWRYVDSSFGLNYKLSSIYNAFVLYNEDTFLNDERTHIYFANDTGGMAFYGSVFKTKYMYETGNLMTYLLNIEFSGRYGYPTYRYSGQTAILFGPNMLNSFLGKNSAQLPSEYNPKFYYGLGQSLPRYEYRYQISNGFVTSMIETTIGTSTSTRGINDWRSAVKYVFHYTKR